MNHDEDCQAGEKGERLRDYNGEPGVRFLLVMMQNYLRLQIFLVNAYPDNEMMRVFINTRFPVFAEEARESGREQASIFLHAPLMFI